jgi:hypothetical protein
MTSDFSAAVETISRANDEPVSIPWALATLCADCETVHSKPGGACPRCTSSHNLVLSRLLDGPRPASVDRVAVLEEAAAEMCRFCRERLLYRAGMHNFFSRRSGDRLVRCHAVAIRELIRAEQRRRAETNAGGGA